MSRLRDQRFQAIGNRLRDARINQNKTMAIHTEISRKYGIKLNQSYYSKIERGLVEPPLRTLYAICDYLGVDILTVIEPSRTDSTDSVSFLTRQSNFIHRVHELREKFGDEAVADSLEHFLIIVDEISASIQGRTGRGKKTRNSSRNKKRKS